MICSIIVSSIWSLSGKPFGIHEIAPGLVTSFVLLITISLFTEHSKDEEVISYYSDLKDKNNPTVLSPKGAKVES